MIEMVLEYILVFICSITFTLDLFCCCRFCRREKYLCLETKQIMAKTMRSNCLYG